MVDVYAEAKKLFHDHIQDLVNLGWKKEQPLFNVFVMTDTVGKKAIFTCEVEKIDFQKEIYSISATMQTDDDKEVYRTHLGVIHESGVVKE